MILVTGATGDVGGEIARQLLAAGEKVRVLARDPAKAAARFAAGVDVAKGDLLQPDTLTTAFAGAKKAFVMGHAQDLADLAHNAFVAAKSAGVEHVVFLSSSTVLTDPLVAIGRWHLAAERELEASGMAWTMLRPGNFASNALRWAPMIKAQGAVFAPAGTGKSAPIDPHDIASVGAKALLAPGHEGKQYVLTGEELLTTAEQVDVIGAAIGKTLRYVDVPEAGARAGMRAAGMNEVIVDALMEVMARVRAGLGLEMTSTVRDITGRPARTFAEWVAAHKAAFA